MPEMNETDLLALKDELDGDPGSVGYSGMAASEVAASLNAPSSATTQRLPIPVADILTWMDEHGKTKIIDNNLIGPSPADEAKRYQLVTSNPHRTMLDPNNPYVAEGFTDLQDVGLLTQAELNELLALAEVVNTGPSRGEALGLGRIYAENVEAARAI